MATDLGTKLSRLQCRLSSCPAFSVAKCLCPEVLDARTLAVATRRCPGIGFTGPCPGIGFTGSCDRYRVFLHTRGSLNNIVGAVGFQSCPHANVMHGGFIFEVHRRRASQLGLRVER